MTNFEIQESLAQSISQLTLSQQLKLLDFIKSIQIKKQKKKPDDLLKFAGAFDQEALKEMKNAIKDCEQIDDNEW